MATATTLDPITLSVIRGRIDQLVNEMDRVLIRSAFSPIICEANDMTNGLYRPDGRTVAQGDQGLPIFAGNMEFAVRAIVDKYEDEVHPGDAFLTNDPYKGGTHLMDTKVVQPLFEQGELLGFLGATGHWIDVGSASAGGFSGKSQEVYQEGVRIPPLKLSREGRTNEELLELLFTNSRRGDDVRGDFKAQLNALERGRQRFKELVDEYGLETLTEAVEELERRSEQQMRSHLREIPDGVYEATDYMDNDGIVDEPLPISVAMTVEGSDVELDFAGSALPCKGPLNIAESCTVSGCNIAFKHIFPDIPINAGCFAPLDVRVPERSLLNAQPPRATNGYTETSQRVVDVVMQTLARAIPEQVPANAFSTSSGMSLGSEGEEDDFVMTYAVAGGYGGSRTRDGLSHCTPPYARARMPSVEVMEEQYPVRFHRKGLRVDSAGPGTRRGGLGTVYDIEVLCEQARFSVVADRGDFMPSGVAGGQPAKGTRFIYLRDGEEYVSPLRTKDQDIPLSRGDHITMRSPGGGGYGPPRDREPERVLRDVRRGYITPEHAREEYGVAVESCDGTLVLDREETDRLRAD